MADIRDLLAVVLGALLGLGLLIAPRTALRLSAVGGRGRGRHRGEYGADGEVPALWVWGVRALGAACVGVALLIASRAYL